jgi:hypothetical protein
MLVQLDAQFVNVSDIDISLSNGSTPRYYNKQTGLKWILGKLTGELKTPINWGDSAFEGPEALYNYLEGSTHNLVIYWGNVSPDEEGEAKLTFDASVKNLTVSEIGGELHSNVTFEIAKDSSSFELIVGIDENKIQSTTTSTTSTSTTSTSTTSTSTSISTTTLLTTTSTSTSTTTTSTSTTSTSTSTSTSSTSSTSSTTTPASILDATIGAAGDYTSVANWVAGEAGDFVADGEIRKGRIIDSALSVASSTTITGATTNSENYWWLTSDVTVRHTGQEGTGARITPSTDLGANAVLVSNDDVLIDFIEINCNQDAEIGIEISGGNLWSRIDGCIIHGAGTNSTPTIGGVGIFLDDSGNDFNVWNCLIYDITDVNGSADAVGILINSTGQSYVRIFNNSLDEIGDSGDANCYGIKLNTFVYYGRCTNNIVMNVLGTVDSYCYYNTSGYWCQSLVASDNSAIGDNALNNANYVNFYANTTTRNYRLVDGAYALGMAVDLSAYFDYDFEEDYRPYIGSGEFYLPVNITGAVDLTGVGFDLTFDDAVLDYVGELKGIWLNGGDSRKDELLINELATDHLYCSLTLLEDEAGVSGSGILFYIRFDRLTSGDVNFVVSNVLIEGSAGTVVLAEPENLWDIGCDEGTPYVTSTSTSTTSTSSTSTTFTGTTTSTTSSTSSTSTTSTSTSTSTTSTSSTSTSSTSSSTSTSSTSTTFTGTTTSTSSSTTSTTSTSSTSTSSTSTTSTSTSTTSTSTSSTSSSTSSTSSTTTTPVIDESTIGAAGDYTNITNWLSAAPSNLITSGIVYKGRIIDNDSFDEFGFVGFTTGPNNYFWLTVDNSVRHTGKAGTGARIISTGGANEIADIGEYAIIENLELDGNSDSNVDRGVNIAGTHWGKIKNCIIHNISYGAEAYGVYRNISGAVDIINTLIYDIENTNNGVPFESYGIYIYAGNNNEINIINCTVDDIRAAYPIDEGLGIYPAIGIYGGGAGTAANRIRNCIATNCDKDFDGLSGYTVSNSISSDDTIYGNNSLTNRASSSLYIDEANDDYHLRENADALNYGLAQPYFTSEDFEGDARPYAAGNWDIGCDEGTPFAETTSTSTSTSTTSTTSTSTSSTSTSTSTSTSSTSSTSTTTTTIAVIENTIGAAGDYTTIDNWVAGEAGNFVLDGELQKGIMIDNAAYNTSDGESITGATTDINHYWWLTSSESVRHDGTAGSGPRLVYTGSEDDDAILTVEDDAVIEWIEINGGNNGSYGFYGNASLALLEVKSCIIHNIVATTGQLCYGIFVQFFDTIRLFNNLIYDVVTHDQGGYGIRISGGVVNELSIYNNTVKVEDDDGDNPFVISVLSGVSPTIHEIRNNIAVSEEANPTCFSGALGNASDNISSDDTAPGIGSFTNVVLGDLFVNYSSDDYEIKPTSAAYNSGYDLSSYFTIDIAGRTRPIGAVFDIGCYEATTTSTTSTSTSTSTSTTSTTSTSTTSTSTTSTSTTSTSTSTTSTSTSSTSTTLSTTSTSTTSTSTSTTTLAPSALELEFDGNDWYELPLNRTDNWSFQFDILIISDFGFSRTILHIGQDLSPDWIGDPLLDSDWLKVYATKRTGFQQYRIHLESSNTYPNTNLIVSDWIDYSTQQWRTFKVNKYGDKFTLTWPGGSNNYTQVNYKIDMVNMNYGALGVDVDEDSLSFLPNTVRIRNLTGSAYVFGDSWQEVVRSNPASVGDDVGSIENKGLLSNYFEQDTADQEATWYSYTTSTTSTTTSTSTSTSTSTTSTTTTV